MLRTLTDFHARIEWRTAQAKPGWLYAGITTPAVTDSIYSHHQAEAGCCKTLSCPVAVCLAVYMLGVRHFTWSAHLCIRNEQVDRVLQNIGISHGQLTLSWMKGLTLSKG